MPLTRTVKNNNRSNCSTLSCTFPCRWFAWLQRETSRKLPGFHFLWRKCGTCSLACSSGVFLERAICSRKRHVETSQREKEMGHPRTYRKGYYFYSPQSSTVIKSKMEATTTLRTRTRFGPPKIRLHCRFHVLVHFFRCRPFFFSSAIKFVILGQIGSFWKLRGL